MGSGSQRTIVSVLALAAAFGCGARETIAYADSWTDGLSRCAPGAKLDDCLAALKKAGLAPEVSKNAGRRRVHIDLSQPYDFVGVFTDEQEPNSGGRITQVKFSLTADPGKERAVFVKWLSDHLTGAKSGTASESGSGFGCGASESGPAWGSDGVEDPEVQLALKGVPWARPPKSKSPGALFESSKASSVMVCFMLPRNDDNTDYAQLKFSSVFAEFVKSPLFAQKTKPAPAKP